jgi:hypothetical protein
MPSVCTYAALANVLSRRGDLGGAAGAIEQANELVPLLREAQWWQMIETRIRLAPALAAVGRHDEAAMRLDEAAALLATHDDAGALHDWHAEASRRVLGRRFRKPERLSDAQAGAVPSQNTLKSHT